MLIMIDIIQPMKFVMTIDIIITKELLYHDRDHHNRRVMRMMIDIIIQPIVMIDIIITDSNYFIVIDIIIKNDCFYDETYRHKTTDVCYDGIIINTNIV